MSSDGESKPLSNSRLRGPVEEFSAYCEGEFERRRNSGETFDEEGYREAMQLALNKLRKQGVPE